MRDASHPGRLGPPPTCTGAVTAACVPTTATYPITATTANDIEIFHPDIFISYARSWSIGFQRALSRDMAVEIRYVGTRNYGAWDDIDFNELNIAELNIAKNGFLDEFRRAQANLIADIAAGRGNTFAFTGAAGTSPLPTYLAYFTGSRDVNNPAAYTGSNWTNSSRLGELALYEPDPYGAANTLIGSATFRNNALNAGIPINNFLLNPHVDEANVTTNDDWSRYNSLQIELRRRFSRGLLINGSYTFSTGLTGNLTLAGSEVSEVPTFRTFDGSELLASEPRNCGTPELRNLRLTSSQSPDPDPNFSVS